MLQNVISNDIVTVLKAHTSWRHLLLQIDVIRGIRRYNVVFTLGKQYIFM